MKRIAVVCLLLVVTSAAVAAETALTRGFVRETSLEPGQTHDYTLRLRRGESAAVVVRQQGVDVIVEVHDAAGTLIDSIDSPNGRNGDEPVEIISPSGGMYRIRVRPFNANEPSGRYTMTVQALRDVRATRELLRERAAARSAATAWLRARSVPLTPELANLGAFAEPARTARMVGIGEATHGSRELGDLRLALTRRLIERDGYRLVTIEASASRLAQLAPYIAGEAAAREQTRGAESGWIGGRTQHELIEWTRAWNIAHPGDRVRIVGTDAQDNAPWRAQLTEFLPAAYGERITARWLTTEKALATADANATLFENSSVDPAVRQFLLEIRAMLELDQSILTARFGAEKVRAAQDAASGLAQFADFNAGVRDGISHDRDWYMATHALQALNESGAAARGIYWAHNAHVAAPRNGRTTGALLREVLQCGYQAVAVTFGEGGFLAQLPGSDHRIAAASVPRAGDDTIEAVLAPLGASLVAWPCNVEQNTTPAWLQRPQAMHWIGALYSPGGLASQAFRPFDLLHDFNAIVYLPRVVAEPIGE